MTRAPIALLFAFDLNPIYNYLLTRKLHIYDEIVELMKRKENLHYQLPTEDIAPTTTGVFFVFMR